MTSILLIIGIASAGMGMPIVLWSHVVYFIAELENPNCPQAGWQAVKMFLIGVLLVFISTVFGIILKLITV